MAAIDWPTTLPPPSSNGFSRTPKDSRVISQNDDGPPKVRRRSTANGATYQITLELTAAQVGYLETFWDTTLNGGTEIFNWTDPILGSAVEVLMLDLPSISPAPEAAGEYVATLVLERMPS